MFAFNKLPAFLKYSPKKLYSNCTLLIQTSLENQLSVCKRCMSRRTERNFTAQTSPELNRDLFDWSDEDVRTVISSDFTLLENFITKEEEAGLLKEVERYLKKVRYEYDHWDNAIHGFRETEKSTWSEANTPIIQRIRDSAFSASATQLKLVHILDLAKNGYIKPHVDSVKFCGSTVAGLCLLSPAIMRLVHTENENQWVNILLRPRSLYIMRDSARYDYTHEILKEEESLFRGVAVPRDRRISVMCRNEVSSSSTSS